MATEINKENIQMRKFAPNDVKRVYELANDASTRENSYSSDTIVYEDHVRWFNDRLHDENFIQFIAEHDNNFVGQVKFDIEGDEALIGISITPEYRGRKLGPVLISLGVSQLVQYRPRIKVINAYIKKENIPSVKIFEKAGFTYSEEMLMKKIPSYKYILKIK